MSLYRIEVQNKKASAKNSELLSSAELSFGLKLSKLISRSVYWMHSKAVPKKESLVEVFGDPVLSELILKEEESIQEFPIDFDYAIEVSFLPGVTDNKAKACQEAWALVEGSSEFASGQLYFVKGAFSLTPEQAQTLAHELLANVFVERAKIMTKEEFLNWKRFEDIDFPKVELVVSKEVKTIPMDLPISELMQMNEKECWAMTKEEMEHVIHYFKREDVRQTRMAQGLSLHPTDVEMEIIAQSWSEHCKHKIFSAHIDYTEEAKAPGPKLGDLKISGLFKNYIKKTTEEVIERENIDWAISVFTDNAGIVRFDPHIDLCIKVETHNSPSALDPYGGALTGILGVNRDILGTGMGAVPIANLDVFCLSDPDWPGTEKVGELPSGVAHPRRILKGVHLGVEDGGNKSGIPTVAGAFSFDRDFAARPLIFVGTIGALRPYGPDGRPSFKKTAGVGDLIVVVGGAVGRDGIHGATFSSLEQNPNSPASAVQIGDPLTQKRVLDFLNEARALGLYSSITDNGAGGLSSSVGEMALQSGGARLDISQCPLKYPGLRAFEIMVSESQERMTLAVPLEKADELLDLAKRRDVTAAVLGQFTNSSVFEIYMGEEKVAHLDLHFLHESLPKMNLKAHWNGPGGRLPWKKEAKLPELPARDVKTILFTLLSRPNIASKENWARRYDHEVGAATILKPFVGPKAQGPGNGGALWAKAWGGDSHNAFVTSVGLCPRVSLVDAYQMAIRAHDEALRNVVVMGANPEKVAMLDNFCWPDPVQAEKNPHGSERLAQLVRACEGLKKACTFHGTPLVSGKDSMKNNFKGQNKKGDSIAFGVLPTLLVTALAQAPYEALQTSELKNPGDLIYLLGAQNLSLLGSELLACYEWPKNIQNNVQGNECRELQEGDLSEHRKLYRTLHLAMKKKWIHSAHDISEGGTMVALAEKVMGSSWGASVDFKGKNLEALFGEGLASILVSVDPRFEREFTSDFLGLPLLKLGHVTEEAFLRVQLSEGELILSKEEMLKHWQREF